MRSRHPDQSAVAAALDLCGLKLETTFTGKAFEALLSDARAGLLAGADVLFWDTYNSAPLPAPGLVERFRPCSASSSESATGSPVSRARKAATTGEVVAASGEFTQGAGLDRSFRSRRGP